jgi:hypothetical protein
LDDDAEAWLLEDAQVHLRHASITTTGDIYVQEIPESVRAAVNATTREILGIGNGTAELGSKTQLPKAEDQVFRIVPELSDLSDGKLLKAMVDAEGIEPSTCRLRVECSAS